MATLFVLLILIAAFAGLVVLLRRWSLRNSSAKLLLKGAGVLIPLRLGVFWFLLFLHWTGRMGYSSLVLMVFLLPEAVLLPRDFEWTLARALGVSVLLSAGSFLWSALAVLAVRQMRKRGEG